MSDDGSPVVEEQKKKRGRPAKNADKGADKLVKEKDSAVVKEPKKRGRQAAEKNNSASRTPKSDEDEAPAPVKRGRGRPKGSHKKKVTDTLFKTALIIFSKKKIIYSLWNYWETDMKRKKFVKSSIP